MAKQKQEKTNVMRILDQKKIPYTAHFYDESQGPEGTREYGVHVAAALGQDPARGFKTLAARGASKGIYIFEVPVAESLDLKKAAKAVHEKSIEMLPLKDLTDLTGYVRGGCTCIGMKKQFPVVLDESAKQFPAIMVSGGRRGSQMEVNPEDLMRAANGTFADIVM